MPQRLQVSLGLFQRYGLSNSKKKSFSGKRSTSPISPAKVTSPSTPRTPTAKQRSPTKTTSTASSSTRPPSSRTLEGPDCPRQTGWRRKPRCWSTSGTGCTGPTSRTNLASACPNPSCSRQEESARRCTLKGRRSIDFFMFPYSSENTPGLDETAPQDSSRRGRTCCWRSPPTGLPKP